MSKTTAQSILQSGLGHMQDRAATYDKPEGERSMGATVEAFNAVTGLNLTTEQGWLFQILLKAVRSQQGAFRLDNYEDGAAYFGLMGEAAAADRDPKEFRLNVSGPLFPHITKPDGWVDPPMKLCPTIDMDERRADIIGQNGNDGEHYDAIEQTEKRQFKQMADRLEVPARAPRRSPDAKPKPSPVVLPNTDALVDPTGKPSWIDAPSWAMWLAQSKDGAWRFYLKKPSIVGGCWVSNGGRFQEFNSGEVVGRWQDTLEAAPGRTVT